MLTTLYSKFAAVLPGLLCLIGGLYIVLTLVTTRLYCQEVTQKLNRTLAQQLVVENMPLRGGQVDSKALQDIFHLLMIINPSIEVYLLDPRGTILAYSAPPGRVQRQQVALEPVYRFLRGSSTWLILADDPRQLTQQKVFSVAPIPGQEALEGYLYIVLAGEEYDSVAQMLQGSYMLRLSIWAAGAGLVFAVVAGLLLFYLLTRRLRQLTAIMEAFQQSDVAGRTNTPQRFAAQTMESHRGDEIDRLGVTFQALAQRIRQQVQILQHTDMLRRELVAHVSHDLRTPLAALHGYLETLASRTTSSHHKSGGTILMPLSDSTRPLSEAVTDPAQIAFTPDGSVLVVTEKSTNRLVTYTIGSNGRPSDPTPHDATGITPFGFAFGKRSQLFISEAFGGAPNASAVSSYAISHQGDLQVLSPSAGTTQTAACWVVVTNDGRFAYVTNTGSGSTSSYEISFDGGLTLLNALAGKTGPGSGPIDVDLTHDGRFLSALSSAGKIDTFRVQAQGGLTPLPGVKVPTGSNGLAAR